MLGQTIKYRFTRIDIYPVLELDLDGEISLLTTEQKLRRFDMVYLGGKFEEILDPLIIPANPEEGRTKNQQQLGCTNDPRILKIFDQFWDAANSDDYQETDWIELPQSKDAPNDD